MKIIYLNILIPLIYLFILKQDIPKSRKLLLEISNGLQINLKNTSNKLFWIKLEKENYNFIWNEKDFNCKLKLNKCRDLKDQNFKCDGGKPKISKFKFYEKQSKYYEMKFCYSNTKNSTISIESILEVLKFELSNFDILFDIDFSEDDVDLNNIKKYSKFDIIINPEKPKEKDLIDIKKLKLSLKINEGKSPKTYKFDNVDFSDEMSYYSDFEIFSNNKELIEFFLKIENLYGEPDLNKDIKGELTIKNEIDKKVKKDKKDENLLSIDYEKDLKNIVVFNKDNGLKLVRINGKDTSKWQNPINKITIGLNYYKDKIIKIYNFDIKDKEPKIYCYKKSKPLNIIWIIIIIIIALIVILIIITIILKKKKKNKKLEGFQEGYIKKK